MTGEMVKLPSDEDTPEKVRRPSHPYSPGARASADAVVGLSTRSPCRLSHLAMRGDVLADMFIPFIQRVEKIFRNMDRDKDAKLTFEEFVEGSKQDPTIVQVSYK